VRRWIFWEDEFNLTGSVVYNLNFTREMMDKPILQTIGRKFRVALTIRRAMLSEAGGSVEIGLSGPIEEIERTIAELQTTGVTTVGPLSSESLVGAETGLLSGVGRGT
jgi:hypothetical protein